MSHVNGDDIDEIFRRASEKYPLRTDNGDWGKLAADLESDPSMILAPLTADGDRRRKRKFFWLILLLPLVGAGYYATQITGHSKTASPSLTSSSATPASATPASAKVTTGAQATASSVTPGSAARGAATPLTADPASTGKTSSAGAPRIATPSANTRVQDTKGSPGDASTRFSQQTGHTASPDAGQTNTAQLNTVKLNTAQLNTIKPNAAQANAAEPNTLQPNGGRQKAGRQNDGQPDAIAAGGRSMTSDPLALTSDPRLANPFGLQRAPIAGGIALKVNVRSAAATTHTDNATPTPTKLARSRQSSFYAGLLAAPDISTVKMQSVRGVGTTFSLLLGYNINSKWAIETGVSLDRKKYYTDGEYFSTKKITVPPNVDIANVDGVCNMWEIPLNLRYNFGQGGKMRWFATAGLSTYLMTKEHYSYQFEYSTGGTSWPYQKTYPTNSNYLFSVFNLSIGYEQKIGKIGNLRLEPYLRVPLAGLGTGSLPIMSAGLNIGITRRIW